MSKYLFIFLTGFLSLQCAYALSTSNAVDGRTGKYADINGIKMYYEVHGEGAPLLMIHGNSGDVSSMDNQIEHFSKTNLVIAADSRGHGKSGLNTKKLTYEMITDDLAALLKFLGLKKVNVIGLSDGGVIGLKLAIKYPELVNKLAIAGANTAPPKESAYSWAIESESIRRKKIAEMIRIKDESRNWVLEQQVQELLFSDPLISNRQLESILSPVLIMAGDKDIIMPEHTLSIFKHIKNSHLAVFPGQTHFVANTDPRLFNATVERFFIEEFKRPESRDYFD